MDGLLIDSEPLWREAIVRVFNNLSIPITLEQCEETMGMRIDEVVKYWFNKFKIEGIEKEKVVSDIVQEVIRLIKLKGKIMEGVHGIVDLIASQGIPIALASSSFTSIINAVLEKISIKDKIQLIYSAENESHGKPHPGVYITTAKKLGVAPEQCLAFEDSISGVLSAKAAKMKCVAVPDALSVGDKRFGIADLVINSLKDFTVEHLVQLE